jgi:hypothetical protein
LGSTGSSSQKEFPPIISDFGNIPKKLTRTIHPYDDNTRHILTPGELNDIRYIPPHPEQHFTKQHPFSQNATWNSRQFSGSSTASPDNFYNRYPAPSSLSSTVKFTPPLTTSNPDHRFLLYILFYFYSNFFFFFELFF